MCSLKYWITVKSFTIWSCTMYHLLVNDNELCIFLLENLHISRNNRTFAADFNPKAVVIAT